MVTAICGVVDELRPNAAMGPRSKLIQFVQDRPGHDRRYAIDASKIGRELAWQPKVRFEDGLRQTVTWYLEHTDWVESVRTGAYRDWIRQNYDERTSQ